MYEIRIRKTEIKEMPAGKEWEKGVTEGEDGYGYTPEIMKKREVTTIILEQQLEELDLPAVIKAVNKL